MKANLKIISRDYYKTKDGKQQLALLYTAYRKTATIGLGISIRPSHWNEKTKTVKAGDPRSLFYNKHIKEKLTKGERIMLDNYDKPIIGIFLNINTINFPVLIKCPIGYKIIRLLFSGNNTVLHPVKERSRMFR